ncbi:hypothetical protein HHK36_011614 [Tetracentron sinense]|uniref:Uncharacterized protein n=1 Tax=Tetracentron sinense TaxID=13715 RepID=A0A834ZD67_TETSI|nr:hypothetical protein HHK36_011614 [Tetracentron sinense]
MSDIPTSGNGIVISDGPVITPIIESTGINGPHVPYPTHDPAAAPTVSTPELLPHISSVWQSTNGAITNTMATPEPAIAQESIHALASSSRPIATPGPPASLPNGGHFVIDIRSLIDSSSWPPLSTSVSQALGHQLDPIITTTTNPGHHLEVNTHPMQTRGKLRAASLLHSSPSLSIPTEPTSVESTVTHPGCLSITKDRWDFSITWNIQRWSGLLAFYCFRESEQINVGNVWIVGSDGSEEEEQEAFVERIESKNEYFETAEFHLVSVEEYLLG